MDQRLIISVALTGGGTSKEANPAVPVTPQEIAADAVACCKAGAAVAHIHCRDEQGRPTMDLETFKEVVTTVRNALKEEGLDMIINLTTSGGPATEEERLLHLKALQPDMCSYDVGTFNWGNAFVFDNTPKFLKMLGECVVENNVKPEMEIFDGGMLGNANYYIKKGYITGNPHYQFILGVSGGLDGTVENLVFLKNKLPENATWSCSGIGKCHVPMLLASIAMGANGVRVGLEDNIYYNKGELATNEMLVARAARIAKECGRTIATAEDTREILGLREKC
ncbi:MAG: 3-keto-5-aminohexanoate cleavage protein [Lachnospiraceae bacterium]|jgi:3-keto-5-aminohexanoate cleavage enzyme|uniref:3-keto-5-aminohexanoate cleavage protein n=1 Tax=Eubacterium ramulus TaxID=39490 RepID=UPI001D94958C|nr:3-keto-5-aminohexanoate cleavage protein [Eubacterium ramulus]MBS5190060.1 3-keto-5-aminohexanoate cleavage protein [Lachnospiraceae bacterium]